MTKKTEISKFGKPNGADNKATSLRVFTIKQINLGYFISLYNSSPKIVHFEVFL